MVPRDMWNLSFPPGMEPLPLAMEEQSLNHGTAREIPRIFKTLNKFRLFHSLSESWLISVGLNYFICEVRIIIIPAH